MTKPRGARSRNRLSLHLSGDLPASDDLRRLLGRAPTSEGRRGDVRRPAGRPMAADVWILDLARCSNDAGFEAAARRAVPVLWELAPALASLDRSRCSAQLRVSSTRMECQGGITLPAPLVAAAAAARLAVYVSLLVSLADDEIELGRWLGNPTVEPARRSRGHIRRIK